MSWRTRWRIYEYVRNSIWMVPLACMLLAIVLGLTVPQIDEHTDFSLGISFGVDAARGVLSSIAGGMITFTGFVFSILLLAVQFGSSQFSPRMLRRFLRDPTTKASLGIFIATFIYALVVLRVVGTADNENFVPDNAISLSLALLMISMLVFLRLISNTTQGLRVAAVLRDLGKDGARVIDRVYPDRAEGPDRAATPPSAPVSAIVEYAGEPGILQTIDRRGLAGIARENDVVIELLPPIGDLVAEGTPLFRIHGEATIEPGRLHGSIAVGDERTLRQDPAFVFRLLADISSKALSPGVNDPTTSAQALDQIELLLRTLGQRRLTPGELTDEDGTVRLLYPAPSWEDFLSIALDETRFFGETSVQVVRRLRALLDGLRAAVPEFRRPAIDAQIAQLDASVERSYSDPGDRAIAISSDRQGIGSPAGPDAD